MSDFSLSRRQGTAPQQRNQGAEDDVSFAINPKKTVRFMEGDDYDDDDDDVKYQEDFLPQQGDEEGEGEENMNLDPSIKEAVGSRSQINASFSSRNRFSEHFLGHGVKVQDDISLPYPGSYLRYKDKDVCIFNNGENSFVLERRNDPLSHFAPINVKYTHEGTISLFFYRTLCALAAFLVTGFLLCFGVLLILFVFLGTPSQLAGLGTYEIIKTIGALCSLLVFVDSLSSIMAMATYFIQDSWNGQIFMKALISSKRSLSMDSLIIDWTNTFVFALVPLITALTQLYLGEGNWWSQTVTSWLIGVLIYYVIFAILVIFNDINGCLTLVHCIVGTAKARSVSALNVFGIFTSCLWRLKHQLSGFEAVRYICDGDIKVESYEYIKENSLHFRTSMSVFSRFIKYLAKLTSLYKLHELKKHYKLDEVYSDSYLTNRKNWGLDKFFFRNRNASRTIGVIGGTAQITKHQTMSSAICYFSVLFIGVLSFTAVLIWFDFDVIITLSLSLVFVLLLMWRISEAYLLIKARNDALRKQCDQDSDQYENILSTGHAIFQFAEASDAICIIFFAVHLVLFLVYPAIVFIVSGNVNVGIIFITLGVIELVQNYLGCSIPLKEIGSADRLILSATNREENWRKNNILKVIATRISHGRVKIFWVRVFQLVSLVFGGLVIMAMLTQESRTDGSQNIFDFTHDFEYHGRGISKYPSCSSFDYIIPDRLETALHDYSILSQLAYSEQGVANSTLSTWFKGSTVINHQDMVKDFRRDYEAEIAKKSAVAYKLIGFPEKGLGVVTIRGTLTLMDILHDIQLWAGAAVGQIIRSFIPLGNLFTPAIVFMIKSAAVVERSSLADVAYYRQTSAFVQHVQNLGVYENIVVVGHSLGGGLAMITGAQTKTLGIAFSGPNLHLSRHILSPRISSKDLDLYTFNVIPDRDIVPMLDDLAQNYQRIKCNAASNEFYDCHMPMRTVCEIIHNCGSFGRPIPCACVEMYGYELPAPIDGLSQDLPFCLHGGRR